MDTHSEQGFLVTPRLFAGDECDLLIQTLQQLASIRGRAGIRHLMRNPHVETLAHDQRLLEVARAFLGELAIPFRATLFEKTSRANWLVVWHQDTALPLTERNHSSEWGPWSRKENIVYAHAPGWALSRVVALRLHLDASDLDNGPLRIIPGSHKGGVLSDEEVFSLARSHKQVNCLVPRGGVLAMRPLLIHSSSKARNNLMRRVLHLEYADSLRLAEDVYLNVA